MTYTPNWKKRVILICGLLENLIFTGSILGWSALNHMLKQEGVYEHHCVWVPRDPNHLSSSAFANNVTFKLPVRTGNEPPVNTFESIDKLLHSDPNSNLTSNSKEWFEPSVDNNSNDSINKISDSDLLPNLETNLSTPSSTNFQITNTLAATNPRFATRNKRQNKVTTLNPNTEDETNQPEVNSNEEEPAEEEEEERGGERGSIEGNLTNEQQPKSTLEDVSTNDSNANKSSLFNSPSNNLSMVRVCKKQDTILNLAYTIGTFLNGFTAFVWGFLLDRWGLRIVRLIINAFLTAGCVLLCFTTRENSYLIFPAVSLLCLGGVPLRIADMQFANLFPNRRSSVITFYSGAFSASSIIFVLLKYVYEIGISFQATCFLLVFLSLLMLPITLFVLPADRVREDDNSSDCPNSIQKPPPPTEFKNPTYRESIGPESIATDELKFTRTRFSQLYQQNVASVTPSITLEKFAPLSSPMGTLKHKSSSNDIEMPGNFTADQLMATVYQNNLTAESPISINRLHAVNLLSNNNNIHSKSELTEKELLSRLELIKGNLIAEAVQSSLSSNKLAPSSNQIANSIELPLSFSLRSAAYLLHQWWFSWLITYMIMYVGSMGLWIGRVTEDVEQASQYLKIYGFLQVLSLIIAPLAGLLMDRQVANARCEPDPFLRRLRMAQSGFWPILVTTLSLAAVLLCKLFDHQTAVYVSIVFNTLLRSFLVAVATAYLRIRFPAEHFNKLLGIMSTVGALVTLIQFPLFILESSPETVVWVHLFNAFCTGLAFLNPLLLLVSPLQRHLVRKEVQIESDFRSQFKQ